MVSGGSSLRKSRTRTHRIADGGRLAQGHRRGGGSIRMARKSLTLVSVGPVTSESPSAWKKPWPSLSARRSFGRMPSAQARAERVRCDRRAGDLLLAVDAVGVGGEGVDAVPAVERDREREQELDVAAAAAVAAHRHRRLAAREQDAGGRERLAAIGDLQRDPGVHLADVLRLALDGVAEDVRRNSLAPRHRRRRLRAPAAAPRRCASRRARAAGRPASPTRRGRSRAARGAQARSRCRSGGRCRSRRRTSSGRRPSGPTRCRPGDRLGRRRSASVSTRAGWHAAASRPPLIAETCRRTQFISPIVAPDASSARLSCCLSASVAPAGGSESSAEPPPEIRQSTRSFVAESLDEREDALPAAATPAASGTGCAASTISIRSARDGVAVARDDETRQRSAPMVLDRARHRRRRLAGADDDEAPGAERFRRRQVRRDAERRLRARDGGVEHAAQQRLRLVRLRLAHCTGAPASYQRFSKRALVVGHLRRVVERHLSQHDRLLIDLLRMLAEQLGRLQRDALLLDGLAVADRAALVDDGAHLRRSQRASWRRRAPPSRVAPAPARRRGRRSRACRRRRAATASAGLRQRPCGERRSCAGSARRRASAARGRSSCVRLRPASRSGSTASRRSPAA